MTKREVELEIERIPLSIEEIKYKIKVTKEQQVLVVKNRIELKNKELLDLYNKKIEAIDNKIRKYRNRVLKQLKKAEYR